MVTHPTTLGLRDRIEDYNIASMSSCININITPPADICTWIASIGGASAIPGHSALILTLINGYLVGSSALGFTVTSAHILGCIDYYLGDTVGGNNFTHCNY